MKEYLFYCLVFFLLFNVVKGNCDGPSCGIVGGNGWCGNGRCEKPMEDCNSCPVDCGICEDCPSICGNKICEIGEGACNCTKDCGPCCVNGICDLVSGENYDNCPADCAISVRGFVVNCETKQALGNPNGFGVTSVTCYSRNQTLSVSADGLGGFLFGPVAPGEWTCTATLASFLTNSQTINLLPGQKPENRTFQVPLCPAKGNLAGVVRTNLNKVVPEAKVECRHTTDPKIPPLTRVSSSNGIFQFISVPPGNWSCKGEKVGFVEGTNWGVVQIQSEKPVTQVDLFLERIPSILKGFVVDFATGKGVEEEIFVDCTPQFESPRLERVGTGTPEAGRFVYNNVLGGTYSCNAHKEGWFGNTSAVTVEDGGVGNVEIWVRIRPGHINGTVLNIRNNDSVPAATVTCTNGTGIRLRSAQTGSNPVPGLPPNGVPQGFFSITFLPAGNYSCSASEPRRWKDSNVTYALVVPARFTQITIYMEPKPGHIIGLVQEPELFGSRAIPEATVKCDTAYQGTIETLSSNVTRQEIANNARHVVNYNVSNIEPGPVGCRCEKVGYRSTQLPNFTMTANDIYVVNCLMRPILGSLSISVTDIQTKRSIPISRVHCISTENGYDVYSPDLKGQRGSPHIFQSETTLRVGTYYCEAFADPEYLPSGFGSPIPLISETPVPLLIELNPRPAILVGTTYDRLNFDQIVGVTVLCSFTQTSGIGTVDRLFASTMGNGSYVFFNILEFNNVTCRASHPDYHPTTNVTFTTRGNTTQLDFYMQPLLSTIIAEVVDGQLLTPLPSRVSCSALPPLRYSLLIPNATLPLATPPHTFKDLRGGTYVCYGVGDPTSYGPSQIENVVVSGEITRTIQLRLPPKPAQVTGTVLDAADLLNKVPFPTFPPDGPASISCEFEETATTRRFTLLTTTVNGTYGFANLTAFKPFTCIAQFRGYTPVVVSRPALVRGQNVVINFELIPLPSFIRGYAVDKETGGYVKDIKIETNPPQGGQVLLTDSAGYYFVQAKKGNYSSITATGTGFYPGYPTVCFPTACDSFGGFRLEYGNDQQVNFTLTPIPSNFSVSIRDSLSNTLIQGATVVCTQNPGGAAVRPNFGFPTGSDGQATFINVRGGSTYDCQIDRVDYFTQNITQFTLNRNDTRSFTVNLVPKPSFISGYVYDSVGLQYPGVLPSTVPGATIVITGPTTYTLTTDARGFFSSQVSVTRGTYTSSQASIAGFTPGYPTVCSPTLPCTATGGFSIKENQNQTLSFTLTPFPGALTATIVDNENGSPVVGATVNCTHPALGDFPKPPLVTNSTGGVIFPTPFIGNLSYHCVVMLRPTHDDGEFDIFMNRGENKHVLWKLQRRFVILTGKVADALDLVVGGATVSFTDWTTLQPHAQSPQVSDSNGLFRVKLYTPGAIQIYSIVHPLLAGSARLNVPSFFFSTTDLTGMIVKGPPNDYNLNLVNFTVVVTFKPAPISGTLTTPDGKSPQGFEVKVYRIINGQESANPSAITTTAADGKYNVQVTVGIAYLVRVTPAASSGYGPFSAVTGVLGLAGEVVNIPLAINVYGSIVGIVRNVDGQPVPGTFVTVTTTDGVQTIYTSNTTGAYTFAYVRSGQWPLCANPPYPYSRVCTDVVVNVGQQVRASDLTLTPRQGELTVIFWNCGNPAVGCAQRGSPQAYLANKQVKIFPTGSSEAFISTTDALTLGDTTDFVSKKFVVGSWSGRCYTSVPNLKTNFPAQTTGGTDTVALHEGCSTASANAGTFDANCVLNCFYFSAKKKREEWKEKDFFRSRRIQFMASPKRKITQKNTSN